MKQAIWIGTLLLVAFVTAGFQLDRQSRKSPEIYVPSFAQYFSLPREIEMHTSKGDTEQAMRTAQVLVSRRPVPAENLRMLAQLQLAAGDTDQGMTTIQLAARRGWRDRSTQEAMAEIAFFAGAPAETANRLAALMARFDDSEAVAALAEATFSRPEGQTRMAEILANDPRWEARFLRQSPRDVELSTLAAVLFAAHEKGAQFSCEPLARIVEGQRRLSDEDRASQVDLSPLLERNCSN